MKAIFPLLLCYVLMTSQSYALVGGPVFGNGTISAIGSYSGTLLPTNDSDVTNLNVDLGIFTLSVPNISVATGFFLLFSNGQVFQGTLTASVDPDTATVRGVLNAAAYQSQIFTTSTGTQTFLSQIASASGRIRAQVRASSGRAFSSARMTGDAVVQTINTVGTGTPTPPVTYTVSGFRQSTTATSSAIGTATAAGGGTGGGTGG